ncbi:hypothetical protein J7I80_05850 [Bacillus sp. ISL-41]|uniref:hypothetical protein n=1 Tax=Bacillus sp. ISL-41 TaxID=2819127 RepID=UPI001BE77A2C|nr:hypothetical protein [Bacillus sp. ISL-41]MBT2641739.1 hypothetical protein [Bacillus sp. ISL-41]
MQQYDVVRSTGERDEKIAVIDALSLEEAHAIAKVRFQESIKAGETLYTFQSVGTLKFDENDRFILPQGQMMSIQKWE